MMMTTRCAAAAATVLAGRGARSRRGRGPRAGTHRPGTPREKGGPRGRHAPHYVSLVAYVVTTPQQRRRRHVHHHRPALELVVPVQWIVRTAGMGDAGRSDRDVKVAQDRIIDEGALNLQEKAAGITLRHEVLGIFFDFR